jgi:hypothetical protein
MANYQWLYLFKQDSFVLQIASGVKIKKAAKF